MYRLRRSPYGQHQDWTAIWSRAGRGLKLTPCEIGLLQGGRIISLKHGYSKPKNHSRDIEGRRGGLSSVLRGDEVRQTTTVEGDKLFASCSWGNFRNRSRP